MKRKLMSAALGAVLLTGAPVAAQADEWEDEVRAQLLAIGMALDGEGWEMEDFYTDSLYEEGIHSLSLQSEGGLEYGIVAVCDTDCSDLDLYLYDDDGDLRAQDAEIDEFPVVQFVAYEDEAFELEIEMYLCSVEPCRYGVAVFTR